MNSAINKPYKVLLQCVRIARNRGSSLKIGKTTTRERSTAAPLVTLKPNLEIEQSKRLPTSIRTPEIFQRLHLMFMPGNLTIVEGVYMLLKSVPMHRLTFTCVFAAVAFHLLCVGCLLMCFFRCGKSRVCGLRSVFKLSVGCWKWGWLVRPCLFLSLSLSLSPSLSLSLSLSPSLCLCLSLSVCLCLSISLCCVCYSHSFFLSSVNLPVCSFTLCS